MEIDPLQKTLVTYATNKQAAHTLGTCQIPIRIEGRIFETTFQVVADLREELILGFPWLEQHDGLIDTVRRCLYVGRTPRIITHWRGARAPNEPTSELRISAEQIGPKTSRKSFRNTRTFLKRN